MGRCEQYGVEVEGGVEICGGGGGGGGVPTACCLSCQRSTSPFNTQTHQSAEGGEVKVSRCEQYGVGRSGGGGVGWWWWWRG